jgi:hypothetical protein
MRLWVPVQQQERRAMPGAMRMQPHITACYLDLFKTVPHGWQFCIAPGATSKQ